MAAGNFNQIPEQCRGLCDLQQSDVDKHGNVLSLNCDGPSYDGSDPEEVVRVRHGDVISVDDDTSSALGRVACTNRGLNLWLHARTDQFKNKSE